MIYYVEFNDEKFAIQFSNFATKIGGAYEALFGLTPGEVISIQNDAIFFSWTVNNLTKIDTYKKNWTSFKGILRKGEENVISNVFPVPPVLDTVPTAVAPGIQLRFTTLANRIKAHQNYTTAIGQNLGIEPTAQQRMALENVQPTLKAIMRGGEVNLDWLKQGYDGILIEKDSGSGFVFLDKDSRPNFVDKSPMPAAGESALWRYRAMYLINDERVGNWSDIATISVGG